MRIERARATFIKMRKVLCSHSNTHVKKLCVSRFNIWRWSMDHNRNNIKTSRSIWNMKASLFLCLSLLLSLSLSYGIVTGCRTLASTKPFLYSSAFRAATLHRVISYRFLVSSMISSSHFFDVKVSDDAKENHFHKNIEICKFLGLYVASIVRNLTNSKYVSLFSGTF